MTVWLDRMLGRVTMYRLVAIILAVLAAAAVVLGSTGVVAYSGLAMLASLAVVLAAAHAVNAGLARAFRVRPHLDSTTITAALLFFLLPPTLDPRALAMSAVAAAVASASKYLIAVRGRHVLNPAATGAFVVGVLNLTHATWWIGTPPMLPLVAVGAFLVLFRTRRMPLGALAVALAGGILITRFLLSGVDPASAIGFAFASSPLVFAVGFMLSEPLTLPPRRWQQLLVGAVFAIVLTTPFSTGPLLLGPVALGPLSSTPELALLVANVIAFALGQRRGIRLELVEKRPLTPTSWEFELEPTTPVRFTAGQFIELSLPHSRADARGARRVFSIASAAHDSTIRIGVRTSEPLSSFKKAMLELEPGDRLTATSVGGDFVLPRDPGKRLLLVAGGIGITPFIGHLHQLAADSRDRDATGPDVVVAYAVGSHGELAYLPELEKSGYPVVLAAPEPPPRLPEGWSWVGGRLTAEAVLERVPDAADRITYLSGPPALVNALRRALRKAGVRRIRTDVFLGY